MLDTSPNLKWWLDGRFGVSYHFGIYSIPARGEWVRSIERLNPTQYRAYFDQFNPTEYDPKTWARLARQAGATYAILTTKHHDGFCLFDSKLTEFKSTHSPARRDLVREYVQAFRDEGLRVGLYYSLVDWHHPDFPFENDRQHPLRHTPATGKSHDWQNYIRYFHGQVSELLTNYGTIDMLVFDFSYWDFVGEKWGATDLVKKIRALQPNIILNDRLANGTGGSLKHEPRMPWTGDFDTCELNMPHRPTTTSNGALLPWELWITHNNSWGYSSADQQFKSPADIIRSLANCVSKGGNLTLNFSPDARGNLAPISQDLQRDVGSWMALNRSSIQACGPAPFERPDWGRFTQSNDGLTLYAHITEQPMGQLTLPNMRGKVRRPRLLATGAEAFLSDYWNLPIQQFGAPTDVFLNIQKSVAQTCRMPDPIDTVVAMDLVPPDQQARVAAEQTAAAEVREPFP